MVITPDGSLACVTYSNIYGGNDVLVYATATNTGVAAIQGGVHSLGLTIAPGGAFAYVADYGSNTVDVITTVNNTIVGVIGVGAGPIWVAIAPNGNSDSRTNLVSDVAGEAAQLDPHLKNPWGLARTAASYWWAADEVTGVATQYDENGNIQPAAVTIAPATGTSTGSPTGVVALGNSFVFVTLDGTISQWTSGNSAVMKVDHSSLGAVYTGCTVGTTNGKATLFVANATGGAEAYDTTFKPLTLMPGAFVDPNIPVGFTPYGIQRVGEKIYVTFAQAAGAGLGYVDAFDDTGKLLLSLQQGSWMNQPWGIAQAPAYFGAFSSMVLVANTGSGRIAAFNPSTGAFVGMLKDSTGAAIRIGGIRAIYFGAGGISGPATTLYFTAGIAGQAHGLFGSIIPE